MAYNVNFNKSATYRIANSCDEPGGRDLGPSAGRLARIMAGVENMLEIFATEMRVAMTLTGVTPVARIDRTVLV